MTTTGQKTAKPPVSPHASLTALERVGTASWGSAVWSLACTCGARFEASTPRIKSGMAKCMSCSPKQTARHIAAILAVLPGTFLHIERKTKLTFNQIQYAVDLMRAKRLCFVGEYMRPIGQGSYRLVFHAGDSDDVPCDLKPIPKGASERKYRRRVKAAIAKASQGGKEDPRYMRAISLHFARQTAAQTRVKPATWLSALGGGV